MYFKDISCLQNYYYLTYERMVIPMGNIAFNGNVSADSTVAPFSAGRAVDGTIEATHRWVGEVPCSLNLTCSGNKLVNRWVVSNMSKVTGWALPGWPSPQYNMSDYSLQGSNDGTNWTNIDTVTGNTVTTTDRTLNTPAYYPYFRVYVTKGLNCNNKIASIMDFQLYDINTSQYLSSLTISSGTLTPAFNKNVYSYSATVGSEVTSITVTPTAEVPTYYGQNATIKVNDTGVASGSGIPVSLAVGQNTINIDVTSAVGGVTQRYTIVVTRVDTYLSNVQIKVGKSSVVNDFNMYTTSYTETSPSASALTVTPTAHDPSNVTITVNGTTVASGNSTSVPVTTGQTNNISIIVKSNSNSAYTLTYSFAIRVG